MTKICQPAAMRQMKQSKVSTGLINPEIPGKVSAARQSASDIRVKVFNYWQALPMGLLRNPDFLADECKVNQCISLSESIFMIDDVSVDMIAVRVESVVKAVPLPGYQQPQNAF